MEAVYVPLHNSVHREWTVRAVAAGKHVLCEKPLGMNAGEAEEMGAAAHKAGVLLMEAFMYRFHPRPLAFVDGLRDPIFVQATFGFTLLDKANFRMRKELGGGALLDVGCYTVNVARWILGEPDGIMAVARGAEVDMTELTVVTRGGRVRLEEPFNSTQPDPYRLMVESFGESVLEGKAVALPVSDSIANMKVLDRIAESAGKNPVST